MLFRYAMNSSCTYANMKADIYGIVAGTITSTGGLSGGANTGASAVYGTYPTSNYSVQNSGTSTFSKLHSSLGTYTHYFRLGWDGSTGMTSFSLANSYTSGTDTLVNSYSYSLPTALTVQSLQAIDIVVNDNCLFFHCPKFGIGFGIFDIGHNGLTRVYTSGTMMMLQPILTGNPNGVIPYSYNLQTYSYSNATNIQLNYLTPAKLPYNAAGALGVLENPCSAYTTNNGSVPSVVYGLNKINDTLFIGRSIYADSSNVRRLVIASDSLAYSIQIY
jgi:hypothetical protein